MSKYGIEKTFENLLSNSKFKFQYNFSKIRSENFETAK